MNDQEAKIIVDKIFKDIFRVDNPFSLEEIQQKFTHGINLPVSKICAINKEEIWLHNPQPQDKYIGENAFYDQLKTDDWMKPKRQIKNIDDVLKYWDEVRYMTGDKTIESQNIAKSDSVSGSSNVYHSSMVFSSKDIVLCHNEFYGNYMLASQSNNSCSFGFRLFDNTFSSSSYEVRWSKKISRSLFINNSSGLYECMFCFGLKDKKFCVSNMQFLEDEYFKIKKMVIDWIIEEAKNRMINQI